MNITGYRIEGQIGQGGMAIVYRAIQESLGRPVALKVMNPLFADSPEFSERFVNEGRLLASLRHNNIITIYDIGICDGFHYISMEYVDGGDLKQRIGNGIRPETALDYVITIGNCLRAAHAAHIVHRDVKPVNILFRRDNALLLTDFGIAKQLGNKEGLTVTGSMLGSPYYLSPEQALGNPIDGRADIYSLGIVLYEMLVRERPFKGDSEIDIVLKHVEGDLPRLPQSFSHFQPLLDRMTAKQPEDRFSDAATLLQAAQYLRDTGLWNGTEVAEKTVILGDQRKADPASSNDEGDPDVFNKGGRLASKSWNFVSGNPGKLATVVSVLALAVGIVAVGLPGPRDKVILTQVTSSRPAETGKQAEPDQQVKLDSQAEIDKQAKLAKQDELDKQAELDKQIELARQAEIDKQARLAGLLRSAQTALSDYRLTVPHEDSAYYYYEKVLELDPGSSQATSGFTMIADRYFWLARKQFNHGRDKKARHYVDSGLRVKDDHPELLALKDKLTRQDGSIGGTVDRMFRRAKGIFN